MITLVVPTRNRAFTLRKVATSYFAQELVSEIIFVIDAGTDETEALVRGMAGQAPSIRLEVIRNPVRSGAAHSRNAGAAAARNDHVLYCDDDQYLSPGYARICLEKMQATGADIVCGRMVHLLEGETMQQGIARFGHGLRDVPPFDRATLDSVMDARTEGDVFVPTANNAILTRRALVLEIPFDTYYSAATGWREEGDFQMNAYVRGYRLLMTNDAQTVHLSYQDTATGGARTNQYYALWCVVRNTRYFYRKFHRLYVARSGEAWSPGRALLLFSTRQAMARVIRPAALGTKARVIGTARRLTGGGGARRPGP